jgi:hypothetical protein
MGFGQQQCHIRKEVTKEIKVITRSHLSFRLRKQSLQMGGQKAKEISR